MKFVILAVGRIRPPFVDDAQHYRKLLGAKARVEVVEVRTDEQAVERIPERATVALLAADGDQLDSLTFANWVLHRQLEGREVWFVIGGAFGGITPKRVDHRISLGTMTMPHQLARIVLLEQLFRAHKILANEPYHY